MGGKNERNSTDEKKVSITLLVWHMYAETKKAFLGTGHENDFFFYYDALSLMTAKETMEWMEEVDIKNTGSCQSRVLIEERVMRIASQEMHRNSMRWTVT